MISPGFPLFRDCSGHHWPLDGADAGGEFDGDLVAVEAAGELIVVRGFVVAQEEFEGAGIFPCGAGGDFGGRAGFGRAAGNQSWRRAGQRGRAALPRGKSARNWIGVLRVAEREGARAAVEIEHDVFQSEAVGFEFELLAGNFRGVRRCGRALWFRERERGERVLQACVGGCVGR